MANNDIEIMDKIAKLLRKGSKLLYNAWSKKANNWQNIPKIPQNCPEIYYVKNKSGRQCF